MMNKKGFTLLELIIGAAISAVLLAALYACLNGVIGLKRQSYAALDRSLPEEGATVLIKRDLMNMAVPTGLLTDTVLGQEVNENGRRYDTLSFCTTTGSVDRDYPFSTMQKVEYYLAGQVDGVDYPSAQLVRAVTRNLLSTNLDDSRTERSILSGVDSLEIEYYDGELWTTSWDSTTAETPLPKAVRMHILLQRRDQADPVEPSLDIVCQIAGESVETAAQGGAA